MQLRSFGILLKDVSRLSSRYFERHLGSLGLTLDQCKVLARLEHEQGMTQTRLAECTDMDPMTLVRVLDRMEQEGLLERRRHELDRRVRQIYLLPAAQAQMERMWQLVERVRGETLRDFSEAEREHFMGYLQRMRATLHTLLKDDETAGAA